MRVLGGNPGRIIPAVLERLDDRPTASLHVVGEPMWAGRTEAEAREVLRHEALANAAWGGLPVRGLCAYDARVVDPVLLDDVARTHPLVARDGRPPEPSADYREGGLPEGLDAPLAPPPGDATRLRFGPRDLFTVRSAVSLAATAAGLRRTRAADLVLAVNELATNSLLHAGSRGGTLRLWRTGPGVTCEVADAGHIADPLTGRLPPEAGHPGGRGLWLVHQLCDLVEVRTGEDGTIVRVHVGPAQPPPVNPSSPARSAS
jgi:anti-sigma regulatory factor (Ser/Thr protein kinase)